MPAPLLTHDQVARVRAGCCACGCSLPVSGRRRYARSACRQRAARLRRGDPALAQALQERAAQERARAQLDESRGRKLLARAYRRRRRAAHLATLSLEIPCDSP